MKQFRDVTLLFIGFCLVVFQAQSVELKSNTFIPVVALQNIDSETLTLGDTVPLAVAQDVKVAGDVVIENGSSVFATVTALKKHGRIGKGGSVTITLQSTEAVDGTSITLLGGRTFEGEDEMTGTVVVGAVLCPLALLNKGDKAVAGKGVQMRAVIVGNYDIDVRKPT